MADFGLAREIGNNMHSYQRQAPLTTKLVTRWYRPPEIALLDPYYSFVADIWSVGCVFAELIARKPLFPSSTDIEHFAVIFGQLEGLESPIPTEKEWPGFTNLLKKTYPEGMPKLPAHFNRGGLRNFFKALEPTAQNDLADEETIEILSFML